MRAAVVVTKDGPEAIELRDVPEPQGVHPRARGRRLLIRVMATGLSVIDALQSRGRYQYGADAPYVAGSEIAGVVAEADPDTGFRVGDRVGSIVFWGGLAPWALAAPEYTVKLPDHLTFVQGAAVYLNYSTAWYAYHRARTEPGQTVLVHGAAGGVGTAALDLAPAFGARAVAVVSSDAKAALADRYGAALVVRSNGLWLDDVRRFTEGHGVDTILDPVGGELFLDSLRALRIGGTLVVIGFVGGDIPSVKVNRLLLRNLTVTGISMDTMDAEYPGTLTKVRDAVADLLIQQRISPHIGATLPFAKAADALRLLESRSVSGKVVVLAEGAQ